MLNGLLKLSKKPRRVFCQQAKNSFNRFFRRHVRRRKHFSRSECRIVRLRRTTEAQSAVQPFVKEACFFDKLRRQCGTVSCCVLKTAFFLTNYLPGGKVFKAMPRMRKRARRISGKLICRCGGMVDTRDLKSLAGLLRTGSSPVTGTTSERVSTVPFPSIRRKLHCVRRSKRRSVSVCSTKTALCQLFLPFPN